LFKAVDLWATKQCEKQGLPADGATKRLLGEEVIKGIRFPKMKQEDFATVVIGSEILGETEFVSINRHMSSNSASRIPVRFPETERSGSVADNVSGYKQPVTFLDISALDTMLSMSMWTKILNYTVCAYLVVRITRTM